MRRFILGACLAGLWLVGCVPTPHDPPVGPAPVSEGVPPTPLAGSEAPREFALTGTVREVMKGSNQVVIRHDAIPGFMGAMTMPFRVDETEVLEELHAGDEIAGVLEVTTKDSEVWSYRLRDLRVTKPALAPVPEAPRRRIEPGAAVPDLEMTTQEGKRENLSGLRGQWVVLTFIYTRCPLPDFCPLMDKRFAELASRLKLDEALAGKVRLISLSFDPDHDTPEVLARHAQSNGAVPPLWTYAVATHEALAPVAEALGMTYAPGEREISHNLVTAVIDPDGALHELVPGREWRPEVLVRSMRGAGQAGPEGR